MYQSQERFTKLETDREPPTTEEVPLQNNMRDNLNNAPNSDEQFLKSIKLDVPTFHGRLDPQLFLDWLQSIDKYFTWYVALKLTSQASQYRTNVENMWATRLQRPIDTWELMKEEPKGKYVPPSFYVHLLDKRHQFTQDNKSAKEYVAKFDEFLIRCSILWTLKAKLKSFHDFELDLGKTCE